MGCSGVDGNIPIYFWSITIKRNSCNAKMTHVLNSPKLLIKVHNLKKNELYAVYYFKKGKQVNSRAVLLNFKIREEKTFFVLKFLLKKVGFFLWTVDSLQKYKNDSWSWGTMILALLPYFTIMLANILVPAIHLKNYDYSSHTLKIMVRI